MQVLPACDASGVYTLGTNSVVCSDCSYFKCSRRNHPMDNPASATSKAAPPVDSQDANYILKKTETLWQELRGRRIFITGGTGFFGCWLLESFLAANHAFDLQAQAVVLTRTPEQFRLRSPHLADNGAIELLAGDVRDFTFPSGDFPF